MSVIENQTLPCPNCSTEQEAPDFLSINGARRPDLRAAILQDTLGRGVCAACGQGWRVPPSFCYFDDLHGEWIAAGPAEDDANWPEREAEALALFSRQFGPRAPRAVAEMGRSLQKRITYGWAALREKLLCGHLRIDDISLEVTKVLLLRAEPDLPLSDTLELRLVGGDDQQLHFEWRDTQTEQVESTLSAPRSLLADAHSPPLQPLRELVREGLYVDLNRVLLPAADPV